MKKILTILLLFVTIGIQAQILYYRSGHFYYYNTVNLSWTLADTTISRLASVSTYTASNGLLVKNGIFQLDSMGEKPLTHNIGLSSWNGNGFYFHSSSDIYNTKYDRLQLDTMHVTLDYKSTDNYLGGFTSNLSGVGATENNYNTLMYNKKGEHIWSLGVDSAGGYLMPTITGEGYAKDTFRLMTNAQIRRLVHDTADVIRGLTVFPYSKTLLDNITWNGEVGFEVGNDTPLRNFFIKTKVRTGNPDIRFTNTGYNFDFILGGGDASKSNTFTDNRGTPRGIEYSSDYSATYTDRSFADKGSVVKSIHDTLIQSVVNIPNKLQIGNNLIVKNVKIDNTVAYVATFDGDTLKKTATTTSVSGILQSFYSDVSTSGTGETDLYSYTIPANTLVNNGDQIIANFTIRNDGSATSTYFIKTYFAGSNISVGDAAWATNFVSILKVSIIRVSSSVARMTVEFNNWDNSVWGMVLSGYLELTGKDWTTTNVLKITGTVASNILTAKCGSIKYEPAP
ncbi:MAG: hypothetical protein PHW73_01050 [Atribacterota bacterium]|nr:hypothetical protein [Atribacterota bacterium]